MSPALSYPMTVTETAAPPADPLVPLLPLEGRAPDPVALATWHLALASTTAVEVPHDLFALWLFPSTGGVVLLGPDALAQDSVEVPVPERVLLQDQLYQLEEILRRAKYSSSIAVPVRHEGRDVAVILLGSFQRGAFGPVQALALKRLAARLVMSLVPLADVMSAAAPHAALEPVMTLEALPGHIARVAGEAANGPDLVRRLSGVIYPLLPHDRLEILASATVDGMLVPLSGNASRRRRHSGGGTDPFSAILASFGTAATLVLDDLTEVDGDGPWAIGGSAACEPQPARGVLGVRLEVAGQCVGYLLIGSVAREAYRTDDEETLAIVGLLVASRVAGFRLEAEVTGLRAELDTADIPALPLIRSAEALATTGHLGEALNRFSEAMRGLLPHERITLHLRWGDDELIALNPDAPRPFADIPAIAIDTFAGAPVIRAEREWLVRGVEDGEELIVPLVVAGRAVGTLGVLARSLGDHRKAAAKARIFANLVAPHLELIRRGASAGMGPGPKASRSPAIA
jgi:hypothetical protein